MAGIPWTTSDHDADVVRDHVVRLTGDAFTFRRDCRLLGLFGHKQARRQRPPTVARWCAPADRTQSAPRSRPSTRAGRSRRHAGCHGVARNRRRRLRANHRPLGGHSRKVTSRTCAHAITLSANWPYPALTARRGYKSTEKLMEHSGRSGGDGFVRVEVATYPQRGVGRIHAGQHFQHVPQVGDHGFGRRAADPDARAQVGRGAPDAVLMNISGWDLLRYIGGEGGSNGQDPHRDR